MNTTLQIFFITCILIFILLILQNLREKKINVKYSLVWLLSAGGLLILALFPPLVEKLGNFVGIAAPASTVFVFAGIFMLITIFTLTVIVSELTNKLISLTQHLAIMEKRIRELENRSAREEDKNQ